MKISDLFVLHQGNGFELYNMSVSDTSNINFISRTAQNNGVVAKVCKDESKEPFPAGYITVALGGVFYHRLYKYVHFIQHIILWCWNLKKKCLLMKNYSIACVFRKMLTDIVMADRQIRL